MKRIHLTSRRIGGVLNGGALIEGALIGIGFVAIFFGGCSKDGTTKPPDSTPGLVTIEAEGYTSSNNGGGAGITKPFCSGASGTYAVEGVDSTGDWIEIPFHLPEATCFRDSLRGEGLQDSVRTFEVLFRHADSAVAADTLASPPGKGFG